MTEPNHGILVADIGATNGRFAISSKGGIFSIERFEVAQFGSLEILVETYLEIVSPSWAISEAVIAIAGPVTDQTVQLTNLAWHASSAGLESRFGLERVTLINDFEAVAWSIASLDTVDVVKIGPGATTTGATTGIIGPGSGVGISAIISSEQGETVLATEGGHATIPTVTALEHEVICALREQSGHVSIEDVLCGNGFVRLYQAVSHIQGDTPESLAPADVTARAQSGQCANCESALSLYFSLLGNVTGNLALTFDARGGMFLAGGILPRLTTGLKESNFRSRFEGKGPFRDYLARISTSVIVHPYPGLLGASRYAIQK